MCGRFSVNKEQVEPWMMEHFDIEFQCETNLDVRPTQTVASISKVNGVLSQINTQWGIKPSWANRLLINAQGETVAQKRTFKDSFIHRRCLIPCSGWYEWKKKKFLFEATNHQPVLMAGIWFEAEGLPQLVTLTTRPNEKCAEIHQRMPVVIKPEDADYWFNSDVTELLPLIEPIDSESVVISETGLDQRSQTLF